MAGYSLTPASSAAVTLNTMPTGVSAVGCANVSPSIWNSASLPAGRRAAEVSSSGSRKPASARVITEIGCPVPGERIMTSAALPAWSCVVTCVLYASEG